MESSLQRQLRIKYGLPDSPTEAEIVQWVKLVDAAVNDGDNADDAGRAAAFEIFEGVDTVLMFSASDTVKALLAAARNK